jgi:hypothetical protein
LSGPVALSENSGPVALSENSIAVVKVAMLFSIPILFSMSVWSDALLNASYMHAEASNMYPIIPLLSPICIQLLLLFVRHTVSGLGVQYASNYSPLTGRWHGVRKHQTRILAPRTRLPHLHRACAPDVAKSTEPKDPNPKPTTMNAQARRATEA